MLEVLSQPHRFFQAMLERKPNLTLPLLLALTSFVLAGLGQTLAGRLLPALFNLGPVAQYAIAIASVLVFGLLVFGVGGAVIRLLAGPDSRAWEVYGWSFAPGLLVGLVMLPLGALLPITGDLPPPPALSDQTAVQEWTRSLNKITGSAAFTRIVQVLGILGNLWAFWIVWSGLRLTAPSRAAIATGAIALLTIALTVWGFSRQAA
jgi:hypothetical protein